MAALLVDRGRIAEAVRILSVTAAERVRIGLVPTKSDTAAATLLVTQAQRLIGDAEFESLRAEAAKTDVDKIVEYVSRARGKRGRPITGWQSLTPTERRAVSLVDRKSVG